MFCRPVQIRLPFPGGPPRRRPQPPPTCPTSAATRAAPSGRGPSLKCPVTGEDILRILASWTCGYQRFVYEEFGYRSRKKSSSRPDSFTTGKINHPILNVIDFPTRRHRGHPRKVKAEQQQQSGGDTPEQGGVEGGNSADDERFDESLAALGRDSPAQVLIWIFDHFNLPT